MFPNKMLMKMGFNHFIIEKMQQVVFLQEV
jgi:hypothetical protein